MTTTSSRTSIGDPATGAKRATKAASKKSTTAVKAVPKPARGAASPAPPTRRQSPTEARRSASGPAVSASPSKNTAASIAAPAADPVKAKAAPATANGLPPLREGEEPWTPEEVREIQSELESDSARLRGEIDLAEHDIADLLRDSGEGAGDDQADAGTKNFEREHEMSIANNARDMLSQTERALARLAAGTYGVCESCNQPVGKYRLQAFPRATLCMPCKQKQERR